MSCEEPIGVDVDARGLRCPWPALRLARAMREADRAVIVADDPAAPAELAALAAERGWSVAGAATALGPGLCVSRIARHDKAAE